MAASRLTQIATSTGIAAIAMAALVFGAQIALFNADMARIEAAAAASVTDPATRTQWVTSEADTAAPAHDAAAKLAAWQATPGVGGAARVLIATRSDTKASSPKRLLEISRALSLAPTDGAGWLAYADATLRLGYGTEHAMRTYDMATLTARREGDQILARAFLVLREWEQMPEEKRQAAIGQLVDNRRRLRKSDREEIARIASTKTPEVQAQITYVFASKTGGDQKFLKAIGL